METNRDDARPPATEPRRLRRLLGLGLLAGILGVSGVAVCAQDPEASDATRPEPRDGVWMKMHEDFLEQARKGDIGLLFLGDSITRGWANRSEQGPGGIWDRYYGPRRAANFGIGGDRTQHVLWRIEHGELDGVKPEVVVLMIGTNNVHADTPAEIADGVKAIVKALKTKLPGTRVLLLGVFPRGKKPDAVRERLKAVNERIAKLDDGGKTLKYLDIGSRFLNPDGTVSQDVMPDFLHLSRKGYGIWADAMEPTLWKLMEGE
jgi:lysophospholipase L1-like esterase